MKHKKSIIPGVTFDHEHSRKNDLPIFALWEIGEGLKKYFLPISTF